MDWKRISEQALNSPGGRPTRQTKGDAAKKGNHSVEVHGHRNHQASCGKSVLVFVQNATSYIGITHAPITMTDI
jgi:hypothetical protein